MGPYNVVVAAPAFDQDLRLSQRIEDFTVEQLVAEPSVEALDIAIPPRGSRLDVCGFGPDSRDPLADLDGDELRPVVRPDIRRRAAQDEEIGQCIDTLRGGKGLDTIDGGAGDDKLIGNDDSDILIGGLGADILKGGGAGDIFVFADVADSTAGSTDRVADFKPGKDKIDLKSIDADIFTAGDQAFSFTGGAGFSGLAGELRYQVAKAKLYADVDGDATADLVIFLQGAPAVGAGDFIF